MRRTLIPSILASLARPRACPFARGAGRSSSAEDPSAAPSEVATSSGPQTFTGRVSSRHVSTYVPAPTVAPTPAPPPPTPAPTPVPTPGARTRADPHCLPRPRRPNPPQSRSRHPRRCRRPRPSARTLCCQRKSSSGGGSCIPKIGVDAPFEERGMDEYGVMQDPSGREKVGWYNFMPLPNEGKNVFLAGHLQYGGSPAVFWNLGRPRGRRRSDHLGRRSGVSLLHRQQGTTAPKPTLYTASPTP